MCCLVAEQCQDLKREGLKHYIGWGIRPKIKNIYIYLFTLYTLDFLSSWDNSFPPAPPLLPLKIAVMEGQIMFCFVFFLFLPLQKLYLHFKLYILIFFYLQLCHGIIFEWLRWLKKKQNKTKNFTYAQR